MMLVLPQVKAEINNIILEQNQPNPFNQTATIRYRTPEVIVKPILIVYKCT